MFSETLLDHFQHPRNAGELPDADGEATGENPVCGDRLHIWLRMTDGHIREMRWRAEGCAPVIAAASVTSEMVRGMDIDAVRRLRAESIADALGGIPKRKEHAAALVVMVLRRAVVTG
ncbi:MAG TPA: iron-sulfur cluster assembly scaffold protein [Chloroflexota bacterium]|nr:iron-sulfur cluster assembly scaffold protein [Chloroflexota bacterium]